MTFFKRKASNDIDIDKLYVAKTELTTGYDNGHGSLGQEVTLFFLVTHKDSEH